MRAAPRSTLDIREDIEAIIRNYPPLRESRPHLTVEVDGAGRVTFAGNVRTGIIRRVLVDSTRLVSGVTAIDDKALHDDDALLVAVGQVTPPGVYLTAVNGAVVLSGHGPDQTDKLQEAVAAIPGVRAVVANFYASARPEAV